MKLSTLIGCTVLAVSTAAWQAPAFANTQQDKMKTCNADATAKGLKGDDREKFMSTCLSAKPAAPMTQQEKMTVCSKDASAKHLTGDQRTSFMSECLKAH